MVTIRLQCRCRIYQLILIVHLIMEMIACAGPRRAYITDEVAFADSLALPDSYAVHMGIGGLVAVLVIELDEGAVATVAA